MIGDSELTIAELCHDIENDALKPFYEKPVTNLTFPTPKYELLLGKKIGNFLPVQAGRGCPNTCKFCTISCIFKGRYVRRKIDEVCAILNTSKS